MDQTSAYPPAANSCRTQITTTTPSYIKADAMLRRILGDDGWQALDYGAGKGLGAALLGYDTLEPYPGAGLSPTYLHARDIPSQCYDVVVCLNVLNVVDPDTRAEIVTNILRILRPGGAAIIMARGRDVLSVAGGWPGPEPMSRVISVAGAEWYQKGFTPAELHSYVADLAGPLYRVERIDLGPAAVLIRALKPPA